MTGGELYACAALVGRLWPHGKPVDTDSLEAWEPLLLPLDVGPVLAAIHALATEGREWPPPVGVIRKRALDLCAPMPTSEEAWGEVQAQIGHVGSLRGILDFATDKPIQPVWSHPLVGHVADAMGWDSLCNSTNVMADRAHFLRLWSEATDRRRVYEHMTPAARQALADSGVALPNLSAARALESGDG